MPLLDDYDPYVSDDSTEEARNGIAGILQRTDENCAAVKEQLPSPSQHGAFHFIDAGAPTDNTAKGEKDEYTSGL